MTSGEKQEVQQERPGLFTAIRRFVDRAYGSLHSPLRDLIVEHGLANTDKHAKHAYVPHFYDRVFAPYRYQPIRLLEIGTFRGDSVKLWELYFPKGEILGVDNNSLGTVKELRTERSEIRICDAYTEELAEELGTFDLVIDDGPHTLASQLRCLELYYPKLRAGGTLVIEDIECVESLHALRDAALAMGVPAAQVRTHDLRWVKGRHDDLLLSVRA